MRFERIGVAGAGAWGTALALAAARAGRSVVLWTRRPAFAAAIERTRESPWTQGVALPAEIAVTADPATLAAADALLLCLPCQALRAGLALLAPALRDGLPAAVCAKGVERGTLALPAAIAAEAAPGLRLAALSGPSFADEVARGLPTALTIAADRPGLADAFAEALAGPAFRPYSSDDPVGVQVGGAAKNVIAIACGIVEGRLLGDNARAALMTRGLAEITRLALALGGRAETLAGLAGLGDLTLTCNNGRSRNLSFGIALGQGLALDAARDSVGALVEGIATADALADLAQRVRVDMPIANSVDAILHHHADIDATMRHLLARPLRAEG